MFFLKKLFFSVCALFLTKHALAQAKSGPGVSIGMGIPFIQQAGLNYQLGSRFGIYVGYNLLSLKTEPDTLSVDLSMPEFTIHFHPFAGAFFIGLGGGQETLKIVAKDSVSPAKITIEVEAVTSIAKIGWMWGLANRGLWFGIDIAYITPYNPKETITVTEEVSTLSSAYIDAEEAAQKFGETSYGNITFARLGWLF